MDFLINDAGLGGREIFFERGWIQWDDGAKLNVISGVSFAQRLLLAAIPFIPKRMLLRSIREMAEARNGTPLFHYSTRKHLRLLSRERGTLLGPRMARRQREDLLVYASNVIIR